MELGCDAITEKPMTVDAEKCRGILAAVRRTGRDLKVTFNYRYSPRNSKVKEVLRSGEIGGVLSVHFEWLLDTRHGADYFRRWHRDKRNSGGLMVHKATHHFDLINWWLDSSPQTVFGMGDLRFYGRENAEERGVTEFYERAHGSEAARNDPFAIDMADSPTLKALYLDAEREDGYQRDRSVFGDGISIEDTMAVMVRFENGAVMSYSLNAHCPWEGYRVMFNGTKGRLEVDVTERSYVSGSREDHNRRRPGATWTWTHPTARRPSLHPGHPYSCSATGNGRARLPSRRRRAATAAATCGCSTTSSVARARTRSGARQATWTAPGASSPA